MWLSGLCAGLWTEGLSAQLPVRTRAWVADQVPSRGRVRSNHTLMFFSLSSSLSLSLKVNKIFFFKVVIRWLYQEPTEALSVVTRVLGHACKGKIISITIYQSTQHYYRFFKSNLIAWESRPSNYFNNYTRSYLMLLWPQYQTHYWYSFRTQFNLWDVFQEWGNDIKAITQGQILLNTLNLTAASMWLDWHIVCIAIEMCFFISMDEFCNLY